MKLQGFGDNKQVLLLYYVLSWRPRGYSNKPPKTKHGALFLFTSINTLLFSATGPQGAGFVCRVNIHLGLTPETHRHLAEPILILH